MPSGLLLWLLAVAYGVPLIVALGNAAYWRWLRSRRVTPAHWPAVSVLIPARNEAANLSRLLPSLTRQDYPTLEIIVYDDASSDGTGAVARALGGERLRLIRGDGPPPGWIGKPHACHEAARAAHGTLLLFLDADTELRHPGALRRLVGQYLGVPQPGVLTALPRFTGGGLVLVSTITFWVVALIPLPLAARLRVESLGALNGQCWLIDRQRYRRLEPHARFRDAIVEDVMIGRWLLAQGVVPWAVPAARDLSTWMYGSLTAAWHGFRKNFYLLTGRPIRFVVSWAALCLALLGLPALYPVLLAPLAVLKFAGDRLARLPWWVTLLMPVTFALTLAVYLHSAISHWHGDVMWKSRNVLRRDKTST